MTKQKPSQRKALRSTKKKGVASPRDAASRTARETFDFSRGWAQGFNDGHIVGHREGRAYERSKQRETVLALPKITGLEPRGEANSNHASKPVQSPAQALASRLNSENLKPKPEPDPNLWPRLKAFVRKLLRR